jgi:cyclophilin family peptidyl-prolyl cis-trans isomerase
MMGKLTRDSMEGIIMPLKQNVSHLAIKFAFILILAGCGQGSGTTASIDGGEPSGGMTKADFDDARPTVRLRTSLGEMTIELDPMNAPIAVDNFLGYVDRGKYDGTIFHQVVEGYMALGGGYDADLKERQADFSIRNEAHRSGKNLRGTIAMARAPDAIDSATNQFFLNLADNPNLDHRDRTPADYGYCAFGKVVEGAGVLDKISSTTVTDQPDFAQIPTSPIVIESIRRVK